MDAFEEIVAGIFKRLKEPYWTWQGYKINLTKAEKVAIGKHSMPRPEIDILAYRPKDNQLLWIECKSYLDSYGVKMEGFQGTNSRFKVFTDSRYREIASQRLIQQVVDDGLTIENPKLQYCLVAGNIHRNSHSQVHSHFEQNGWLLHDDSWIQEQLKELAKLGYENDVAIITAKLFKRASKKEKEGSNAN